LVLAIPVPGEANSGAVGSASARTSVKPIALQAHNAKHT
jgi:hypothetical protein